MENILLWQKNMTDPRQLLPGMNQNYHHFASNNTSNQTTIQAMYPMPEGDLCQRKLNLSVENIAYSCLMVFLLLASIVGNALVITATCFSRQLRRRVTVYFMISLGTKLLYCMKHSRHETFAFSRSSSKFCLNREIKMPRNAIFYKSKVR